MSANENDFNTERFLIKVVPRNNIEIIGRDEEMKEMICILSGMKNNILLVGNPGVGKTAIVEGLAKKLEFDDNIPFYLKGKTIYRLSIIDLISNAKYQGMLESRIKDIFLKIKESKSIIFIDEIHLITNENNKNQGGIDISGLLLNELSDIGFSCIGATTFRDLSAISFAQALIRRFRIINIDELSSETTRKILRENYKKFEEFYKLGIKNEIFDTVVSLSDEYLDGYLPEKAFSLLDETCARKIVDLWSEPDEIIFRKKELKRLKQNLKNFFPPLDSDNVGEISSKENNNENDEKNAILEYEIDLNEKRLNNLIKIDSGEKEKVGRLIDIATSLSRLEKKIIYLENTFDFDQIDRVRYLEIIPLIKKKKILEEEVKKNIFRKYFVNEKDVAFIVAKRQNLTVDKLLSNEKKIILPFLLEKKIKGQKEAIKIIYDSISRSNVGIRNPNKPFASFMFVGPTGVGKTEIALTIAQQLFGKENFLKLNMNEFSESNSISRLFGSPPGYIGFRERPLFDFIRTKRNSLILLDEIEKCHDDVLNSFLQILDNGFATLSNGELVNFRNTMIITTTNIGYEVYDDNIIIKKKEFEDEIMYELKNHFRPEFLNRFDEIIIFNPLKKEDVFEIIENELHIIFDRVKIERGIKISIKNDKIIKKIFFLSYSPNYGARSIRRFVEKEIGNIIANGIITNSLKSGLNYILYLDNDKFKISDLNLLS